MTDYQKSKIRAYLQSFLSSGNIYNVGQTESYQEFWKKRISGANIIKMTVDNYLSGSISIKEFKEINEKQCREFPFWGFKNFSGQMQLNQYVNNIDDKNKDDLFKKALDVPNDNNDAKIKINEVSEYLSNLKNSTDNSKSLPRVNQSFLITYYWEIQNVGKFPVYYGSSKKVLLDLGMIFDSYPTYGDEYIAFSKAMNEIIKFLKEEKVDVGDKPFWFAEHILWNSYMDEKVVEPKKEKSLVAKKIEKAGEIELIASNSWIPQVIQDLNDLSFNKETEWSKERNIKPEKAFETKLKYAFTIMGYESEELGQGKGREPDGIAISKGVEDGEYAIVYDAKARESYYSVGTGDREMSEYIRNKKTELRMRRVNRIYFLIVSSEFSSNPNDINLIREVYRKTQVPITFLKASDLLFIIENKLKNSDLNHSYLEDLFLDTGIKTRNQIVDLLSNKIELWN
ncbi:MAG: hypothetical protein WAV10_02640 [Minisyncoccia bacterium]